VSGISKSSFSKLWLSYSDQVQLLQQRGLAVHDPQAAEQFLSHLNYYRLSGYCLAFENERHNFNGGTTFDDVVAAYHFDLTLRDLLTEVMSFGTLSQMYKGMLRQDQRVVAQRYGIQASFLKSWMHHCVYVRNLCAHHSRLWDRVWAIRPQLLPIANWQPPMLPSDQHLFETLLVLHKLLSHIPAAHAFTAQWKQRVGQHIAHPPAAPNPLRRMGLTNNWMAHPVWK